MSSSSSSSARGLEERREQGDSPSPRGDEDLADFNSFLYAKLTGTFVLEGKDNSPPDLRFYLEGEVEWVEAHYLVMAQYCTKLRQRQWWWVPGLMVMDVPPELGVSEEGLLVFRKANYLKTLDKTTIDTLLQVRALAEYYGANVILQKVDDVAIITEDNCHVIFEKWPSESPLKEEALKFVKRHLKTVLAVGKPEEWTQELWSIILSAKDLSPPEVEEDDLFASFMIWRGTRGAGIDGYTFRNLFKDSFHYERMSGDILKSPQCTQSGLCHPDSIRVVLGLQERLPLALGGGPRYASIPSFSNGQGERHGRPTGSATASRDANERNVVREEEAGPGGPQKKVGGGRPGPPARIGQKLSSTSGQRHRTMPARTSVHEREGDTGTEPNLAGLPSTPPIRRSERTRKRKMYFNPDPENIEGHATGRRGRRHNSKDPDYIPAGHKKVTTSARRKTRGRQPGQGRATLSSAYKRHLKLIRNIRYVPPHFRHEYESLRHHGEPFSLYDIAKRYMDSSRNDQVWRNVLDRMKARYYPRNRRLVPT